MKHRTWNKFRAMIGRYFWLPCPLCGKDFGGHEWDGTRIPNSYASGTGVCPDCREEAHKITEVFYEDIQQNYWMDSNGRLHQINLPTKEEMDELKAALVEEK